MRWRDLVAGGGDGLNTALAWLYVGGIAHSVVQAIVNIVMLRFAIFMAASIVLLAMSIRAARCWCFSPSANVIGIGGASRHRPSPPGIRVRTRRSGGLLGLGRARPTPGNALLSGAPGTTSRPSYRPKLKIATISTSSGSSEECRWNKSPPGKETQSCARGS